MFHNDGITRFRLKKAFIAFKTIGASLVCLTVAFAPAASAKGRTILAPSYQSQCSEGFKSPRSWHVAPIAIPARGRRPFLFHLINSIFLAAT